MTDARIPNAALYAVAAFAAVSGIVLRAWVLASPLGELDADEAAVGLMARHFLEGEFPVFVWGQPYGGTHGAALAAPVFAVFGSGAIQLKLAETFLFALATLASWRVGARAIGPRAGLLVAALMWVWPGFLVYWSTKANANYAYALLCEVVAILLVLRLRERASRLDAVLLGAVLAQGIWASVTVAGIMLPFLVWLVVERRSALREAVYAVPAFFLSFAPFLVWNARHDWATLTADPHYRETTVGQRLRELFEFVLPSWFGVRTPFSLEWFPGRTVGLAVLALVAAGFVYLWIRRPASTTPFLAAATVFPLFYISSPFAGYIAAPKYLVLLSPVIAVLAAWFLSRRPVLAFAIPVAVAASVVSLLKIESWGLYVRYDGGRAVPADIQPLLDDLGRAGADRVIANESIAPRITFESEERVIATSGFERYPPHGREVREMRFPARVFVLGSRIEREARGELLARGYRRRVVDRFVVFEHSAA